MSKYYIHAILFGLLVGCTTTEETEPTSTVPKLASTSPPMQTTSTSKPEPTKPIAPPIRVKWLDVDILARYPVVVNLITELEFANDCVQIVAVSEKREGDKFIIHFHDKLASPPCHPTPTEYIVPLDTTQLEAGVYTLEVNGVQTAFELLTSDLKSL